MNLSISVISLATNSVFFGVFLSGESACLRVPVRCLLRGEESVRLFGTNHIESAGMTYRGLDKQGHPRDYIFTIIESYPDQNHDQKLSQWAKNQFLRRKRGCGTFSRYVVTPKMAKIW